ncbi:MAG: anti-sigma factor [Chthoniobacterales bacterium]
MNREHIEELAALDALGALDGEDLAAWERACSEDKNVAQLRDELAEVAARLSWLAPEEKAPDALRRRVMDHVFGDATKVPEADRSFGWGAWAAAAAVVLLALAGTAATTEQTESIVVRDMRQDPDVLFLQLSGYGDYAGTKACVLWDSGQRGWYLQAGGLPELPASHSYRVWAVDAGGVVHDCGALPRRTGGLARHFVQPDGDIDSMQGFAISIEPAGSAPSAPTSPAVLISAGLRS